MQRRRQASVHNRQPLQRSRYLRRFLPVLLFCIACSLSLAPRANNTLSPDAVKIALAELDSNALDEHWYFQMKVQHDNTEQIVQSDPNHEPALRRTLIQVDGKEPTEKDREQFRKAESQRIEEQDEQAQAFGHLVDTTTLNFLGRENGIAEYAFIPRIPKLENASESLRGKLRMDIEKNQITALEVFNVEAFSPAFSVSMEHFRLAFEFSAQQGTNLLAAMVNQARGKAGFVKGFDSTTTIVFSEFRKK